jgi:hypothetical protein
MALLSRLWSSSEPPSYLSSASRRRRVASISVDLDPLSCYYRIHGLGVPPRELHDVVLRRGLPRFLDLFARHHIKASFFVVGCDLDHEPGRGLLASAAAEGHELGNHSHTHPYDLARLPVQDITDEVTACHQALRALCPKAAPRGFRSPGYDMSPDLLDVVESLGYRYDSSVFPCPPYYLAKMAAMTGIALSGRFSGAVLGHPGALWAPADPYRPDPLHPFSRGQAPIVELPVAVTPGLRLPAIGTYLLLSERLRIHLLESMRGRTFFNLELHGLDLIDAEEDGIPAELLSRQADLRVPLQHKYRALMATLDRLRGDHEILPLFEVAEEVHRTGGILRHPA